VAKPAKSELRNALLALLPKLRRFALSLTANLEDAEDLLHTTVEKALSRLEQLDDIAGLDKWMFRICRNIWFDEWRKHKVRGPSVDASDEQHEPSVDGTAAAEQQIEVKEVAAALETLPDEQRVILVLIVIEGHSYKEVSAMLEVPIGTVMSRLGRARAKLAGILRPPEDTENSAEGGST
jgi:RNA polymerase sigma factor (sigma-70 family)